MTKDEAFKKLITEADHFIETNNVEYILDNDWRTRFLVLLFPNIAKTITWLTYSMRHLKYVVDEVKSIQDE